MQTPGRTMTAVGDGMVAEPWTEDAATVAGALGSDLVGGLSAEEVALRRVRFGPNEIAEAEVASAWRLLVGQLANTMTAVLAVAAAISALMGDVPEAVAIALIVVLDTVVGFVQEHRAERAMAALRELATDWARVVRDGELLEVPTVDLVPGDLVVLAAGDLVPADLRLAEVHGLQVDEASLTGESAPVAKQVEALPRGQEVPVADRANEVFKGTAVSRGRGIGLVIATGPGTELGHIAELLRRGQRSPTPLQRRLAHLGRRLAAAAVLICVVAFGAGVAGGEPVDTMFLTALSLAVAAIPEGLPAVVTVALAMGARRMAARHAVVRRLPAVETLGSVTVICTDKTGTLTENRMTVERVWTPAGLHQITGVGYDPTGEVTGGPEDDPGLAVLAEVAAACNDATLRPPEADGGPWTITGDPTEAALLAFAAKAGVDGLAPGGRWPRIAEIAFTAERRRMTTAHRRDGAVWVATKGGLGSIASVLHPDDGGLLQRADRVATDLAAEGYRVLALARREVDDLPPEMTDLEHDLRLAGLVAIVDPPRPEAAPAIARCRAAGITPVMITGDHAGTAAAIARRLGLLDDGDGALAGGDELAALDDGALAERVGEVRVFARTDPEQKLRIVDAWKARGAVVAMTGDGVNDAPALRRADIGVAMGITGTDVSREAADMVLTDDDFATIVAAVEEGRRIYANIRRVVRYLLSTNAGEIGTVFLALLLGLPVPLLPLQILWINLVTDGSPAIALGLEQADAGTMGRPPRSPEESILARGLWQFSLGVGALMAVTVVGLQAGARAAGWPWQTMVFTTLALMQLGVALSARSESGRSWGLGMRTNPWLALALLASAGAQLATVYVPDLNDVFGTEALDPVPLAVVLGLSVVPFAVIEASKAWRRGRSPER